MYKNTFGPKPNFPKAISTYPVSSNWMGKLLVIGGPCSIESEEQTDKIMKAIAPKVTYFRGGVFRAGTYPGQNWGWQWDLLKMYHEKSRAYGKHNIVDLLDIRDIEQVEPYADVFQVNMRNAQNYSMLKELGRQRKPVILKRGTWQKLSEFLGSLEYILQGGNSNVILCERGGVTTLDHVRWDLSISMIAMIKQMTKFPVIIDASHGTGNRSLVKPMTLAGIAAGADGCLIETHFDPESSMSDAEQAVSCDEFNTIVDMCRQVKSIV